MKLIFYAIITGDGDLKRGSKGAYAVHSSYKRACYWAKNDGDSVVAVEIDLGKKPLFIRGRIIEP